MNAVVSEWIFTTKAIKVLGALIFHQEDTLPHVAGENKFIEIN